MIPDHSQHLVHLETAILRTGVETYILMGATRVYFEMTAIQPWKIL